MIVALLIFALMVMTLPFWYGQIYKNDTGPLKLETPPHGETKCVEPAEYMRENHVDLLKRWRDSVVRDGLRTYHAKDGKEYTMNLSNTCLRCHSNKDKFCDQCHDYVKASPNCWDCHVVPKGAK